MTKAITEATAETKRWRYWRSNKKSSWKRSSWNAFEKKGRATQCCRGLFFARPFFV